MFLVDLTQSVGHGAEDGVIRPGAGLPTREGGRIGGRRTARGEPRSRGRYDPMWHREQRSSGDGDDGRDG
jgi:hypothetical protein